MKCPACGKNFKVVATVPTGFVVWCSYYRCPCNLANDGLSCHLQWNTDRQRKLELRLAESIEGWLESRGQ